MLFSEMIQEAKNIVQDDSFDSAIAGYVNEAFLQASGRVNIPDLKRVGLANTVLGQMYTPLTGITNGFSGRLSKIINTNIARYKSIEDLLTWISSQNRDITEICELDSVEAVALEGKTLWYFPTPNDISFIQCILFNNPTVMVEDEDYPDDEIVINIEN